MTEKRKVKFVVYEPQDGEVAHDNLKDCKKDIEGHDLDLGDIRVYQVFETRKDVTAEFLKRYFPDQE